MALFYFAVGQKPPEFSLDYTPFVYGQAYKFRVRVEYNSVLSPGAVTKDFVYTCKYWVLRQTYVMFCNSNC